MKRYILEAFCDCYPAGGLHDIKWTGDKLRFKEISEAIRKGCFSIYGVWDIYKNKLIATCYNKAIHHMISGESFRIYGRSCADDMLLRKSGYFHEYCSEYREIYGSSFYFFANIENAIRRKSLSFKDRFVFIENTIKRNLSEQLFMHTGNIKKTKTIFNEWRSKLKPDENLFFVYDREEKKKFIFTKTGIKIYGKEQ